MLMPTDLALGPVMTYILFGDYAVLYGPHGLLLGGTLNRAGVLMRGPFSEDLLDPKEPNSLKFYKGLACLEHIFLCASSQLGAKTVNNVAGRLLPASEPTRFEHSGRCLPRRGSRSLELEPSSIEV